MFYRLNVRYCSTRAEALYNILFFHIAMNKDFYGLYLNIRDIIVISCYQLAEIYAVVERSLFKS